MTVRVIRYQSYTVLNKVPVICCDCRGDKVPVIYCACQGDKVPVICCASRGDKVPVTYCDCGGDCDNKVPVRVIL